MSSRLGIETNDLAKDSTRSIPLKTPRTCTRSVDDNHAAHERATALFDFFDNDEGDELNFAEGDTIEILEDLEDGWCVGRNPTGDVGMFPSNFVKVQNVASEDSADDFSEDEEEKSRLNEDDVPRPTATPRTKSMTHMKRKQSLFQSSTNVNLNVDGVDGEDGEDNSTYKIVLALYDVEEVEQGDELVLKEGDLIKVMQEYDDGWWFGQIGERKGYFPSNCVEEMKDKDLEDAKASWATGGAPKAGGAGEEEDEEGDPFRKSIQKMEAMEASLSGDGNNGNQGTLVGVAVKNDDDDDNTSSTTVGVAVVEGKEGGIPGPPPKHHKGFVQGASQDGGGGGAGAREGDSQKRVWARMATLLGLLLSMSLLAAAMFGVHSTTATITTYPHPGAKDTGADGTASGISQLVKSDGSQGVDFLNTASGTVSVTEGGFLGVDVLVPIEGTSANITSSLVGSFALRDVSSNVIGVSYTLTGLAPNSDFGLRVERDTSCSLAFGARKGEMYDEELYGAGDNASPWNGGPILTTDETGHVSGTALVSFGYTSSELIGKTIVVTDHTGVAGGCGRIGLTPNDEPTTTVLLSYALTGLEKSEIPLVTTMGRFPGYLGLQEVTGAVSLATAAFSKQVAVVGRYPGYTGVQNQVQGYAEIVQVSATEIKVAYHLYNLAPGSQGGIHVHAGSTCSASGGHYYDVDREDPWPVKQYQADVNGHASAFYTVRPGPNSVNVLGRTFVVHDGDLANTRIACGVIQLLDLVQVNYELEGVEALRFGKLAVHEGKSCANAAGVGAPYKNLNLFGTNTDPWGMKYGVTTSSGTAVGAFQVAFGESLDNTKDRVVVVYDTLGAKIGCGQLTQASRNSVEYLARQRIRGGIHVYTGALCTDAGEHFFKEGAADTWGQYTYTTDERGRATGTLVVNQGINVGQTVARTVVVHNNFGTRVGCGVLNVSPSPTASIHPALLQHRTWLVMAFLLVLFSLLLQLAQVVFNHVYQSDTSFDNVPLPESKPSRLLTLVLCAMFVLVWFLMGESTFQNMHRYGAERKGGWGVVFLLLSTLSLLYSFMVGHRF